MPNMMGKIYRISHEVRKFKTNTIFDVHGKTVQYTKDYLFLERYQIPFETLTKFYIGQTNITVSEKWKNINQKDCGILSPRTALFNDQKQNRPSKVRKLNQKHEEEQALEIENNCNYLNNRVDNDQIPRVCFLVIEQFKDPGIVSQLSPTT